jgi:hypothetical protein
MLLEVVIALDRIMSAERVAVDRRNRPPCLRFLPGVAGADLKMWKRRLRNYHE